MSDTLAKEKWFATGRYKALRLDSFRNFAPRDHIPGFFVVGLEVMRGEEIKVWPTVVRPACNVVTYEGHS